MFASTGQRLLLCAFVALLESPATAADFEGVSLDEHASRHFRDAYGLGDSSVRAIAQGQDGYLWIGTDAGLARFDGSRFTVFDARASPILHRHRIRALVADGRGGVWMGMPEGEGLVRQTGGNFETWRPRIPFFLGPSVLSLLRTRDGNLWMGSWKSIIRMRGEGPKSSDVLSANNGLPVGDVWTMAEGQSGEVWAGVGGSVVRIQGSTVTRVDIPVVRRPLVRALALQNNAAIAWIGTDGGLMRWQDNDTKIFGLADGLPSEEILSLLLDRKGTLWVGTAAGVARLGRAGFETSHGNRDLPSEAVTALFEDEEDNVWLGFRSGGVTRLTVPRLSRIGKAEGLPSDRPTSLLATRNGDLWIGTAGDGLMHWPKWSQQMHRPDPPKKVSVSILDGCPPHVTSLLEDAQGRIWVGGQGSPGSNLCMLSRDGVPFRGFHAVDGLADGTPVHTILQLSDGTIWIGADNLHRVSGEGLVQEPVPQGFPSWGGVRAMHEDRAHRLWIATGFIVWYRDGKTWTSLGNGEPALVRPIEHPVQTFADGAQGTLWIGHRRGLSRIVAPHVQSFGANVGLIDDPVTSLVNLGDKGLWLATAKGIFLVSVGDLDAVADTRASTVVPRRFGVDEGMRTARCEGTGAQAILQDPRGRLWFSTGRGLVVIDPANLAPRSAAPKALIERVLVDGVPTAFSATGADGNKSPLLSIPAGSQSIRIEFTAVAFRAPEGLRFHHRLDPLASRWSEPEEDRSVLFANIPSGQYRFSVAAAGADGQWGPPTTSLTVMVAPRPIETWWFRSLLVLVAIATVVVMHRLRTSQLRARHNAVLGERTRIAREIHDTLAQGFTGISLQLEVATRRLKSPSVGSDAGAPVQESLDKARLLVRMSLADARRAVMDLRDPTADIDLGQALRGHAARQDSTVPIDVSVSGHVRRLPTGHEQALLRIAQEAITNALRYASASRIDVALTFGANVVELRVSDDGVGFSPKPAAGFGLVGMNERAQALKGVVEIQSRPGEGTQIVARIPVDTHAPGGPH